MDNCTSLDCFYRNICRSHIDNPPGQRTSLKDFGVTVARLHASFLIGPKNEELLELINLAENEPDARVTFFKLIHLEQKLGGFEQCFSF